MEDRTLALIAHKRQEWKDLRASKPKCNRFEDTTPVAERRRVNRHTMRRLRKAATKSVGKRRKRVQKAPPSNPKKASALHSLSISKNMPMPCCGRRKENCRCYDSGTGLALRKACKRSLLGALKRRVHASRIQYWRDTADMPQYARQVKCRKFEHLLPMAFMWRHYSNAVLWQALMDNRAVHQDSPPSWPRVRITLETFARADAPVHGGFFYSGNVLRKYRYSTNANWIDCTHSDLSNVEKEMIALKVMWHVAHNMRGALNSLQRTPTRSGWKTCTETFINALRERTTGMFAHYSLKICLDGVLVNNGSLMKVCSWWPMLCPAYQDELPKLYPGIKKTQKDLFLAACHFHAQMREEFHSMSMSESLAQLCWVKRQIT